MNSKCNAVSVYTNSVKVHKVRDDGTKITCDNGKFTAVKGRKGKAADQSKNKGDVNDSKSFPFFYVFNFVLLIKMRDPENIYLDDL